MQAQSGIFNAKIIQDKSRSSSLVNQFKDVTVIDLDAQAIRHYVEDDQYSGELTTVIGNIHSWDMTLTSHDIKGSGFRLHVSTPEGTSIKKLDKNITYRGHLKNNPDSKVRFVITESYLIGYINDGIEELHIEPAHFYDHNSPENRFVIYRSSDVLDPFETHDCPLIQHPSEGDAIGPQTSSGSQHARNATGCKTTELVIALDYSYVNANGGEASAIARAIGVMNSVDLNFDGAFTSDIEFEVVEMFVSTCSSCDPSAWTSTLDGLQLLNNFGGWANGVNGFDADFDLGQMWTNRNIAHDGSSNVVGLAWRPGVCSYSSKFHLLEDYSNNMNSLRTLTAHEIGHNFGSKHDTISGHIMWPSVNGSSSWSQLSKNAVNNRLNVVSCLSDCGSCPPEMEVSVNGNGIFEAAGSIYTNGVTTITSSATYSAPNVILYPDFVIMQGAILEINGDGCN